MKHLLAIILLCLASCSECYAGYTVVTRDQVSPKYIMVHGVGKLEQALNPGPVPAYPVTVKRLVYKPADFDLYSADPLQRTELWEDDYGIDHSLEQLPGLKAWRIEQARGQIAAQLATTDYMVIKEVEIDGYTMPAETRAARQALRDRFNSFEAAVNAAATIDEIMSITWE